MKVILIGIICIVWVQNSSATPKWTGQPSVENLDLDTNAGDFISTNDYRTGYHQERPKHLDDSIHGFLARIRKEPPSIFWTLMTAFRGVYILWIFLVVYSWSIEDSDPGCFNATTELSEKNVDQSSADHTDTGGVQFVEVPVTDDNIQTVSDVVQMIIDVVVVVEKLVDDVTISVEMQEADGGISSEKIESVHLPIGSRGLPGIITDNCDADLADGTKLDEEEIVVGCSTSTPGDSSSDTSLSMDTARRESLSRPDDNAIQGTSGILERHSEVPGENVLDTKNPGKKANLFRRAKEAFKKWRKTSFGKKPEGPEECPTEPPLEQKTLEEINRMWRAEKTPSLRRVPKVHFRQRVVVKTFLVKRPMARYDPKGCTSELTQVQLLKREGDFEELGLLPTGNSFKLRLLRGAMKLDGAFRKG